MTLRDRFFRLLRMGMRRSVAYARGHMEARSIKTNLPSLFLTASVVLVLVAWVAGLVYVGLRYI